MAIRVQNGEIINFGTLDAETTVTHARIGFGSNALVVRPLTTQRTIAANGQGQFAVGDIDIVFPANELNDDGLSDLLALYFAQNVWIDLMTDDSTVVTTTGYSQQTSTNWTRAQEAD